MLSLVIIIYARGYYTLDRAWNMCDGFPAENLGFVQYLLVGSRFLEMLRIMNYECIAMSSI